MIEVGQDGINARGRGNQPRFVVKSRRIDDGHIFEFLPGDGGPPKASVFVGPDILKGGSRPIGGRSTFIATNQNESAAESECQGTFHKPASLYDAGSYSAITRSPRMAENAFLRRDVVAQYNATTDARAPSRCEFHLAGDLLVLR